MQARRFVFSICIGIQKRSVAAGVLLDPLGSSGLPRSAIALHDLSDLNLLCVFSRRSLHHGKDGFNHELGIESGDPLLIDGLRADLASVCLYAGVVDLRDELYLGRLERIVVREVEVDDKLSTDERSAFWAIDGDVPDHDIVLGGCDRDQRDRLTSQIAELLNNVSFI